MSSVSPDTAPAGPTAMHSTTVREAMPPGIMACTPTATLAEAAHVMASCPVHSVSVVASGADAPAVHEAAQVMADQGVAHLVVVDHQRRTPLGIISALDAAKVLAQSPAAVSSEGGSP